MTHHTHSKNTTRPSRRATWAGACYFLGSVSAGLVPLLMRINGRSRGQCASNVFECLQSFFWNIIAGSVAGVAGLIGMACGVALSLSGRAEIDPVTCLLLGGGLGAGAVAVPNVAVGIFWTWKRSSHKRISLPIIGRYLRRLCSDEERPPNPAILVAETSALHYIYAAMTLGASTVLVIGRLKDRRNAMLQGHARRVWRWVLVVDGMALLLILASFPMYILLLSSGCVKDEIDFMAMIGLGPAMVGTLLCANVGASAVAALRMLAKEIEGIEGHMEFRGRDTQ